METIERFIKKTGKVKQYLESHRWEIISMMASFAVLSQWYNVNVAMLFFGLLAVHEGGHAWAMKKTGVGLKKVYFFVLGGGVTPARNFRTYNEMAYIAIMGSVFSLVATIILSMAWIALRIDLIAYVVILFSTVTIVNLLPYVLLDGGLIQHCIQKSGNFGQILFVIPEFFMLAFLMIKANIVIFAIILFVLNMYAERKRSTTPQEPNQESLITLSKKEIKVYYISYIVIILMCIVINLILEAYGFNINAFDNFDDIINKL